MRSVCIARKEARGRMMQEVKKINAEQQPGTDL
jgi:hypothetical protein